MTKPALVFLALLVTSALIGAEEPFSGETLVSPMDESVTYLFDMNEAVVMTWHGAARPASKAYLFSDDSILRPCVVQGGQFQGGGSGGRLQMIDASDSVIWDYTFSSYDYLQHHDVEPMPNGNVLMIAWERKTQAEATAAGRVAATGEIWPTMIVEVEPVGATGGKIVWEWHLWDHLVQDADSALPHYGLVADHPELININYGNANGDWVHANAIDYNEQLDQILFSSRSMNEFYVIDHSTTTGEAAGHTGGNSGMGGDFLYRWGNPAVYERGSSSDQYFFVIHGVNWIDQGLPGEGNILAFNNGDRSGSANDDSSVDEIAPPVDGSGDYSIEPDSAFGPSLPSWSYSNPGSFYGGPTQCGAFRLPNGNTIATSTEDYLAFEVTAAGDVVWEFTHSSRFARAQRYWDIETSVVSEDIAGVPGPVQPLANVPNPFNPTTEIAYSVHTGGQVRLDIHDVTGRLVAQLVDNHVDAGDHTIKWDGRNAAGDAVSSGTYLIRLESAGEVLNKKITLVR